MKKVALWNLQVFILLVSLMTQCSSYAERVHQTPKQPSELTVHFVDVGQGDCTLITCDGEAMLIDAGTDHQGTKIQLYLQTQNIGTLKYVIGTHPDADHIGGLDVILYKFDCGTIILPEKSADNAAYRDVIDTMKQKNYKNTLPIPGASYTLGSAVFTVIGPSETYEDTNNSSVSIILSHGNRSFLFTGDAEAEAEQDMAESDHVLDVDVYKAGHHGSSTSSGDALLKAYTPEYAVISCGEGNPYGHPHEEALNRLQARGIQIYRTDQQGTITVTSDGTNLVWNLGSTAPVTYILNTNTHKFHAPDCASVEDIKDKNKMESSAGRDEIIGWGYAPCKRCNP